MQGLKKIELWQVVVWGILFICFPRFTIAALIVLGVIFFLASLGRNHKPTETVESSRWPAWTKPYRDLFKEPSGLMTKKQIQEEGEALLSKAVPDEKEAGQPKATPQS